MVAKPEALKKVPRRVSVLKSARSAEIWAAPSRNVTFPVRTTRWVSLQVLELLGEHLHVALLALHGADQLHVTLVHAVHFPLLAGFEAGVDALAGERGAGAQHGQAGGREQQPQR